MFFYNRLQYLLVCIFTALSVASFDQISTLIGLVSVALEAFSIYENERSSIMDMFLNEIMTGGTHGTVPFLQDSIRCTVRCLTPSAAEARSSAVPPIPSWSKYPHLNEQVSYK